MTPDSLTIKVSVRRTWPLTVLQVAGRRSAHGVGKIDLPLLPVRITWQIGKFWQDFRTEHFRTGFRTRSVCFRGPCLNLSIFGTSEGMK